MRRDRLLSVLRKSHWSGSGSVHAPTVASLVGCQDRQWIRITSGPPVLRQPLTGCDRPGLGWIIRPAAPED
jgi:hypothetical protein